MRNLWPHGEPQFRINSTPIEFTFIATMAEAKEALFVEAMDAAEVKKPGGQRNEACFPA